MDNEKNNDKELPTEELDNVSGGCDDDDDDSSYGTDYINEDGRLVYIVKRGDTVSSISEKYGTNWPVLQELNHIANVNLIKAGDKLIIR